MKAKPHILTYAFFVISVFVLYLFWICLGVGYFYFYVIVDKNIVPHEFVEWVISYNGVLYLPIQFIIILLTYIFAVLPPFVFIYGGITMTYSIYKRIEKAIKDDDFEVKEIK